MDMEGKRVDFVRLRRDAYDAELLSARGEYSAGCDSGASVLSAKC